MNDEIREIFDTKLYFDLEEEDYIKIKDYITNLQNENERLKAKCNNNTSHQINYEYFKTLYSKVSKDIVIDDLVYKCEDIQKLIEANEKLDIEKNDYKSRVEKTTEKLSFIDEALENDTLNVPLCIAKINSALNILQNGSDE